MSNRASYVIKQMSKVIVRKSVEFYSKVQNYRNECFHNENKCRKRIANQCENIANKINKVNRLEMKKHLRVEKLDVNKCDVSCAQLQNVTTTDLMKKREEEVVVGDIKIFSP